MPFAAFAERRKSWPSAAIVCAAGAGLAAGLFANVGRKMVVQGLSATHGSWDKGLKAEHRAVLKIFDKLEQTDEEQEAKRLLLLAQLKHALSKHAYEEENIVYPAMREHGQVQEADELVHDHGYVKQYLFELGETPSSASGWAVKLGDFRRSIEDHVRREEEELFPRLREALGKEGNAHVTAAVNKAGFMAA